MKWSVLDQSPSSVGSTQDVAIRESIALAQHCDALGYERYWVSEHHNSASIVGTAPDKASLVSFVVEGVHPHDLGTILDEDGIAVRTGHHCAMPVMDFFKVPATARASFAFYNRFDEIDRLAVGIERARKMFA